MFRKKNIIDAFKSDMNKRHNHHFAEIERLNKVIATAERQRDEHQQALTATQEAIASMVPLDMGDFTDVELDFPPLESVPTITTARRTA